MRADECAAAAPPQASSASDQISSMDDLRDSVDAADAGEAYAYMYPFLFFEQYKIIVREVMTFRSDDTSSRSHSCAALFGTGDPQPFARSHRRHHHHRIDAVRRARHRAGAQSRRNLGECL